MITAAVSTPMPSIVVKIQSPRFIKGLAHWLLTQLGKFSRWLLCSGADASFESRRLQGVDVLEDLSIIVGDDAT